MLPGPEVVVRKKGEQKTMETIMRQVIKNRAVVIGICAIVVMMAVFVVHAGAMDLSMAQAAMDPGCHWWCPGAGGCEWICT